MMWLVAANTNSCRIFLYNKREKTLTLVKELSSPTAKMKDSELTSDIAGRYSGNGGANGAFIGANDPHQVEVDRFALEIARTLKQGHATNQYSELLLSAQPHMSGCINKHLNGYLKDSITNIHKDLTQLKEVELLKMLS